MNVDVVSGDPAFRAAGTVHGGSHEIRRTVVAEHALGLPKEPRP
ncbi:alkylation response protein AidB-like acyl-CoA dehydrogenase [Streptomyces sp. V4I23]|nr:hypothetical protein [Streptomyces sp. V4I23]MDQ1010117.1 alkylation response protein AidB-like acyl-CoA dehydrogenase [Streptomyces sp. V4I23]